MSRIYVQSEGTAARRRFPVYLVDATDGITAETGESGGQPQISKAGGGWGDTTATLTAIGNGYYYVELTATELDTLGPFAVRYKSANTAEFNMDGTVVAINIHDTVRAGLTALPNAAADAAGGLPISDAGGLDLDALNTNVSAILSDTGTDGVVVAAGSKTGYSLTATTGLGNQTADITGNLSGSVGSVTGAVGSVTGAVGSVGSGGITAASFGAGAIDAAALAADAGNEIADAVLSRNVSNVEGTAGEHTLCTVVLAMLENSISGTTLTILRTDGVTTHATKTLTTNASAEPITGIA